MKDAASAKPVPEVVARKSMGTLLEGAIPGTQLPEIKNTCPLCANEIKTSMLKCPRCGVPLKSAPVEPKRAEGPPAPVPVAPRPEPPRPEPAEHVIIAQRPEPQKPEPAKQVVVTQPAESPKPEPEEQVVAIPPPESPSPEPVEPVIATPPIESPKLEPAEQVVAVPPPETPEPVEHVVVVPPPAEPEPSPEPPEPPEPPETVEPSPGMVTTTPVEPRIRSEGMVNGRGATNGTGLVNGRGMVNGTGLVNGTGMINGTRGGDRPAKAHESRTLLLKRWQFLAVLVAIAIVLPTFIYLSYMRQAEFGADGDFGEWSHVSTFGMQAPASLPEVSVDEWAVKSDGNTLYMYLKTASVVVGTSNVDSFYLFIDSDGSVDSGYAASSIGADYMLEMHGWDQKIESASLMRYESTTDRFNWTSWASIDSLAVAIDGEKLEATANLPVGLTAESRYVLLAQDNLLNQASSVSYPVPEKGGVLIIELERGSGVSTLTGLIPSTSSVTLARLVLKCEGTSGRVETITPVVSGAGFASRIADISLSPDDMETVEILVDTSSSSAQSLVSTYVAEAGVSSTFEDVVIIGEPIRAYVSSPPTSIHIDGAFGDWAGHVVTDHDDETVTNPNVNVTQVGFVNASAYAAFYVSVQGQVFEGSYVPATRGKPTSQGGGGVPVIPQRKTGEDILRIYIDADVSNVTGQLVQRSTKVIGADYLVEIEGVNGLVVSKTLMIYSSGSWEPEIAAVLVAADSRQVETSVPTISLGGTTSFVAIVETTDWRVRSDWAWTGDALDPWVIDASGNTYMSSDGSTWSYLGTPTLAPGDRIVDISLNTDESDVFLVTNTGRTFYWQLDGGTSWTTGQTNPIDTATYTEAVSMTFYSRTGAWLLTRNGSYFYLMDAHKSLKEWTLQDVIGGWVTDFTDILYQGGTMYALRTAPNTGLNYSNNGNNFISVTNPTGSTSNHTQFTYINNGPGSADDQVFVLCENGNIRYSANGGVTWTGIGDLPVPAVGNTTRYTSLGFDAAGYLWVVTDTGYTFRSTDTTTYNTFTCTGRSPITSVVAILPTTIVVPEFSVLAMPVLALVLFVIAPRIRRARLRDS